MESLLAPLVIGIHTLHLRGCKKVGLTLDNVFFPVGSPSMTWYPGQASEMARDLPSDGAAILEIGEAAGFDLAGWNASGPDLFASFMEWQKPERYWKSWKEAVGLDAYDFETWALREQASERERLDRADRRSKELQALPLSVLWEILLHLARWISCRERAGCLLFPCKLEDFLVLSKNQDGYEVHFKEPGDFEGDGLTGRRFWGWVAGTMFMERHNCRKELSADTQKLCDVFLQVQRSSERSIDELAEAWERHGSFLVGDRVAVRFLE